MTASISMHLATWQSRPPPSSHSIGASLWCRKHLTVLSVTHPLSGSGLATNVSVAPPASTAHLTPLGALSCAKPDPTPHSYGSLLEIWEDRLAQEGTIIPP